VKYFSPHILDGSVTTAKLADLAVSTPKLANSGITQSKLRTATLGQSGSIPIDGSVLVVLSPYTFLMDTEMEDGLIGSLRPAVVAVPSANANAPEFNIKNLVSVAKLYDVEWRRMLG